MGELHLEIIVDRLKREFGVQANVGTPQVACSSEAEVKYHVWTFISVKIKKQKKNEKHYLPYIIIIKIYK